MNNFHERHSNNSSVLCATFPAGQGRSFCAAHLSHPVQKTTRWHFTAAVGSKNPLPGKILLRTRKIIPAGVSGIKRAARFGIHACTRAHEWHSFSPFTDSALLWLMLALPPLARGDGPYSRERKTSAENEKQHGTNTGRLRAADPLCAAGPD